MAAAAGALVSIDAAELRANTADDAGGAVWASQATVVLEAADVPCIGVGAWRSVRARAELAAAAGRGVLEYDAAASGVSPLSDSHLAHADDGVLSERECEQLIALTERTGYEPALVNTGGGRQSLFTDYRKSGRCIIDSEDAAENLWQRIRPYVLADVEDLRSLPRGWRPVGLNERLRFLKYDVGNFFAPHADGSYVRESGPCVGDRSFLTLMLYLNVPGKGGATNFLPCDQSRAPTSVAPRTGLGLVFEHQLEHEGAELLEGRRYCIRTDVMFTRRPPPEPVEPEPVEPVEPNPEHEATGEASVPSASASAAQTSLEERLARFGIQPRPP